MDRIVIADNVNVIKQVTRKLPETNSSSSHSLIIDMESVELLDPSIDLFDFDDEGYILLKRDIEFGRSPGKYNDLYTKLVYAASAICLRAGGLSEACEKLANLEKIVADFTGVPGIRFLWIEDQFDQMEYNKKFNEAIPYRSNLEELYDISPGIDHDSTDLIDEVFETDETLKNFLFNRNSYIITDGDYSVEDEYLDVHDKLKDIPTSYVRIHFGDDIGDIDVLLDETDDAPLESALSPSGYSDNLSSNRILLRDSEFVDEESDMVLHYRGVHSLAGCGTQKENLLIWTSENFNRQETLEVRDEMSKKRDKKSDPPTMEKEELEFLVREGLMSEFPNEYKLVKFDIISEEFGLIC